jgi:hypothetical protein
VTVAYESGEIAVIGMAARFPALSNWLVRTTVARSNVRQTFGVRRRIELPLIANGVDTVFVIDAYQDSR